MTEVEVLVIGGGPVGLTTAAMLGEFGIETRLVERHSTTSSHPRGFGIHPRTMEVFRRLRVADAIRAAGLPPTVAGGFGFVARLTGEERARLMLGPMPEHIGPEQGCFCPQYRYEQRLRQCAEQHPSVSLDFGTEATGLDLADGQATVQLSDGRGGAPMTVHPRYIVAADGMHSPVRHMLGATETSTGAFGHSVSVFFRADLSAFRTDQPFALTWTVAPGAEGTLGIAAADETEWTFTFAADRTDEFDAAQLQARVRAAVGDPDVDVEVLDVLRWDYEQAVTDQWRVGPVFFCGDAAHRFPPHGGFGMNSGVQDAENLAWKLAALLRWGAADSLLDTYETERKPVAVFNGQRALINTQRLTDADWSPEHAATSLADQHEHFLSIGQQMGNVYRSAAVLDDGTEPEDSSVTNYVETGRPGARAPHITLEDDNGRRTSTIDACASGFLLLTGSSGAGPDGFTAAPLAVMRLGPGGSHRSVDRPWHDVYGVQPTGAVLIRPDGHVAARFHDASPDLAQAVEQAIEVVLRA